MLNIDNKISSLLIWRYCSRSSRSDTCWCNQNSI